MAQHGASTIVISGQPDNGTQIILSMRACSQRGRLLAIQVSNQRCEPSNEAVLYNNLQHLQAQLLSITTILVAGLWVLLVDMSRKRISLAQGIIRRTLVRQQRNSHAI